MWGIRVKPPNKQTNIKVIKKIRNVIGKGITDFLHCKNTHIYIFKIIVVAETKDQDTIRSLAERSPLLDSHLFLFRLLTTIQVSHSPESHCRALASPRWRRFPPGKIPAVFSHFSRKMFCSWVICFQFQILLTEFFFKLLKHTTASNCRQRTPKNNQHTHKNISLKA